MRIEISDFVMRTFVHFWRGDIFPAKKVVRMKHTGFLAQFFDYVGNIA